MNKFMIMICAFGLSFSAVAESRSYADYPELSQLLDRMRDAAEMDGSFEAFEFSEKMPDQAVVCSPQALTTDQVVKDLMELADEILGVGEQSVLNTQARAQWTDLLGQGPYRHCSFHGNVDRSWVEIQVYIGPNYIFHTETARED